MSVTRVGSATPALAGRQAEWIATMEPWLGLGYAASALRAFLRGAARTEDVFVASGGRGAPPGGILVLQRGVLLGNFVSLLAVKPDSSRTGIGRTLLAHAETRTFARRRWLFVSADATNRTALRFYRKLGFTRVGRLPDLVRPGRTEILLRKGRQGR
jgi:ribosomal protein S18 acetylase RimI-like enzyme